MWVKCAEGENLGVRRSLRELNEFCKQNSHTGVTLTSFGSGYYRFRYRFIPSVASLPTERLRRLPYP